jgi:uncharacterized protein YbjT (DUF2867 family)
MGSFVPDLALRPASEPKRRPLIMNILLFGATGSAGGSILQVCLADRRVDRVTTISRRPVPMRHPKLREVLHGDFADYTGAESAFDDIDACLFCLGKSVTQVSGEAEYRRITHDFPVAAARVLHARSPRASFHFISGAGTRLDGRQMWARVKAETERDLIDAVGAVCWRPAAIDGVPSSSEPWLFKRLRPLYPLLKPFRSLYVSGEDLGIAMIHAAAERVSGRIIENAGIRDIADRANRP